MVVRGNGKNFFSREKSVFLPPVTISFKIKPDTILYKESGGGYFGYEFAGVVEYFGFDEAGAFAAVDDLGAGGEVVSRAGAEEVDGGAHAGTLGTFEAVGGSCESEVGEGEDGSALNDVVGVEFMFVD